MHDPLSKFSAMCHCLLPSWPDDYQGTQPERDRFRYVDTTLEAMLAEFDAQNIPIERLQIKVFGGANVMVPSSDITAVGSLNCQRAKQLLDEKNLSPAACDIGGAAGRTIVFETQTGCVLVKRLACGSKANSSQDGLQVFNKEKGTWPRSAAY
jgi:chemotaxis protein CheD